MTNKIQSLLDQFPSEQKEQIKIINFSYPINNTPDSYKPTYENKWYNEDDLISFKDDKLFLGVALVEKIKDNQYGDKINNFLIGDLTLSDFPNLEIIEFGNGVDLTLLKSINISKNEKINYLRFYGSNNGYINLDNFLFNLIIDSSQLTKTAIGYTEAYARSKYAISYRLIKQLLGKQSIIPYQIIDEEKSFKKIIKQKDEEISNLKAEFSEKEKKLKEEKVKLTSESSQILSDLGDWKSHKYSEVWGNYRRDFYENMGHAQTKGQIMEDFRYYERKLEGREKLITELVEKLSILQNRENEIIKFYQESEELATELLEIKKNQFNQLISDYKSKLEESYHGYLEAFIEENSKIARKHLLKKFDEKALKELSEKQKEINELEEKVNKLSQQTQIEVLPPSYN
ncbi:MAG: tRNA-dihydrouridine(20/20a) synthase [Mycoplasmataceae bacterium]|nr:MAG: tRNA-dihydrouridine(20/20a) synthase [Mycoplasmataceae bacterium]